MNLPTPKIANNAKSTKTQNKLHQRKKPDTQNEQMDTNLITQNTQRLRKYHCMSHGQNIRTKIFRTTTK